MDGGVTTEVPIESIKYALTAKDFEQPPKEVKPYKIGDTIDRENFTPFLIHSFAVSRGKQLAQTLFLRWLEVNQGFDYRATLEMFIESGGFKKLSEEERGQLLAAFDRIKGHEESGLTSIMGDFKDEFNKNVGFLILEDDKEFSQSDIPDSELKDLPYSEFMRREAEYIEILKERQRKSKSIPSLDDDSEIG